MIIFHDNGLILTEENVIFFVILIYINYIHIKKLYTGLGNVVRTNDEPNGGNLKS